MNNFSKNQVNFYTVTYKDENQRLDNLLAKLLKGVPKSYIYKIIRNKEIKVNNKRCDVSYKVNISDVVRIPPIHVNDKTSRYIPCGTFPVLYEDDYYIIIDKPSGIACHGGSGISFGIIEQLRNTYNRDNFLELAHRLDRDTSGALILAKKRQALVLIQESIRNNQIKKYYLALTLGRWTHQIREVKAPLFKYLTSTGERRVRVDKINGQFAHSIFSVAKVINKFTLVKADLNTGRTHQIRVHLQYLGSPIAGDDKYGDFEVNKQLVKLGLKRLFLHAYSLEFTHPITHKLLKITAPLAIELENFIQNLARDN